MKVLNLLYKIPFDNGQNLFFSELMPISIKINHHHDCLFIYFFNVLK
jgi:hypothetical protein